MSQENVEIVRELLESFNARTHSHAFEVYDPDIEWDASRHPALDLAGVYRGHEGVREFWRGWLSAWETISFEVADLVDAGDKVAAVIHQRNRGRATGMEVDVDSLIQRTVERELVPMADALDLAVLAWDDDSGAGPQPCDRHLRGLRPARSGVTHRQVLS